VEVVTGGHSLVWDAGGERQGQGENALRGSQRRVGGPSCGFAQQAQTGLAQRERGGRVLGEDREGDGEVVGVAGPAGLVLGAPHLGLGLAALVFGVAGGAALADERDLGLGLGADGDAALHPGDLLLVEGLLGGGAGGVARGLPGGEGGLGASHGCGPRRSTTTERLERGL